MSWNCWLCTSARCSRRCQCPARSHAASHRRLSAASRVRTRSASAALPACAATCAPTTFSDTTIDLCESRSSRNSRWSYTHTTLYCIELIRVLNLYVLRYSIEFTTVVTLRYSNAFIHQIPYKSKQAQHQVDETSSSRGS